MSFFSKIKEAAKDSIAQTTKIVGHARSEVIGTWNPNRRHDEAHEQEEDAVRTAICESHRFKSFADEREGCTIKWHVDGADYMWALSEIIDSAKECIFILDWWLTPELYLRRPPAHHPEWRLDKLLQRKAQQGVKIYFIVYKEVNQTMSMCSKHSKNTLERLHPNIIGMRHPDHIGSKDTVALWSHHEKVVVVDNHLACVGGLDLCFGRWDTHNHPLSDVHPTEFNKTLFPGQDYNNARIMDFQEVWNYASNQLSNVDSPRMPWHDVHMTLTGPVVLDIVQHFVERWNEIKKRKYRSDSDPRPWLALPHNINVAPNEAVASHPHREKWNEIGTKYKNLFHLGSEPGEADYDVPPAAGTCRVQVVRSVSDWSHGTLVEHSIQNAYIRLIREAVHFIYIENQFFISSTQQDGIVKNLIAQALVERIIQAGKDGARFKVVVVIPEVPGFAGDPKNDPSLKTIMAAQYRTINRGGSSIYEELQKAGLEPLDYIRFYHLRAYDRINAPMPSFINQMEEASGVKFREAQVALARQWLGGDADLPDVQKYITVKFPDASSEGLSLTNKTDWKAQTVPNPASQEEAKELIERFEHGADNLRGDDEVSDSVAQHMLKDKTGLEQEKWKGTPEEELNAYVSELLYIHSKVMIVDDKTVIMGSANINDRSQKGDGDSEIALVVEDNDLIKSTMNGNPYMASRFATTLRRQLYREHLGLIEPQMIVGNNDPVTEAMRPAPHPQKDRFDEYEDALVADPIAEETVSLWQETAHKNAEIFTELFRPVPSNSCRNWEQYDKYVPKDHKWGHVVPGVSLERVKEKLALVKGALVECPLDFLIEQKDFHEGPEWTPMNPALPLFL